MTVTSRDALFERGGRWTVLMIAYTKAALERFITDPAEAEEALREMNDGVAPDVVAIIPPMSDAAMAAFMACYEADDDEGVEVLVDREFVKRPSYPNARQITDSMFWAIVGLTPGMTAALAPLKPRRLATELAAHAPEPEPGHPRTPETLGSALSPPAPNGWR